MSDKLQGLVAMLSPEERLQLMEALWDSVSESLEEMPIPDSHQQELDRRLAACDANPSASSPWDEVKARLRKKS